MAKIDKDAALQLMRSGASDTEIASRFGASRQAANLLRQSLVKSGVLSTGTGSFATKGTLLANRTEQASVPGNTRPDATGPTFDQITDWIIQLIKEAGEARHSREERDSAVAEAEALRAQVSKLQDQLAGLAEQLATASAKSKEYTAAVKSAEIQPISLDAPNPSTWRKTS